MPRSLVWFAAAGVFVVGFWTAARTADDALDTAREVTSAQSLADARAVYREFECMESELRRRLPPGARIRVSVPGNQLWRQRLIEVASPWFVVVAPPETAAYVVGLSDPALPKDCGTVGLGVRRS